MCNNVNVGDRHLLKGGFGDENNEYILKVISIGAGNIVNCRVKYKSNLYWDETIKNYNKNYKRYSKSIPIGMFYGIINNGIYKK